MCINYIVTLYSFTFKDNIQFTEFILIDNETSALCSVKLLYIVN